MAIEDYYGPLTVSTSQQVEDGYGGVDLVDGKPRSIVGYIGRPSSRQVIALGKRGVHVDGRLYAPLEAGVRAFAVIQEPSGERWQVVTEPRDAARRGHHIEADVRRLEASNDAGTD